MKTKKHDSILEKFENFQLNREGMSCLNGGWVATFETKTGKLYIRYRDSDSRIMEMRLDGNWYFASWLPANDASGTPV